MISDLKNNIEQEKKIINEISKIYSEGKQNQSIDAIKSQLMQLKILNDSIPGILKQISPLKQVQEAQIQQTNPDMQRYSFNSDKEKKYITIEKGDKNKFLSELRLSDIKKRTEKKTEQNKSKPSLYARISNKFFGKISEKLAPNFSSISDDLKKANVTLLISTYISMALFSFLLVFIFSASAFGVLIYTDFTWITWVWVPFALSALCLIAFYFYPNSERSSVKNKISQELPFAAIYMSAIAGSDIEPTQIFKIVSASSEYINIGREMRKIIAQVEIYGYDLVTALKNVSKQTSNEKLAELFSGMAINISTGGSLKSYLDKKAENFLLDYKLERDNYSDLAGTFMDVYISILIAAPLVLMMMFIVMNISGLGIAGLSLNALIGLSVGGVILVNIIFLIVLQLKQPTV